MDLSQVIPTLTAAVETIMNPTANPIDRLAAHKICEEFKETSPLCINCGLALSQRQNSSIVRHFGLQLLEHAIKFRWQVLSQDEKEVLKKNALEFIAHGTANILEEEHHIKDGVSRITVELIKREWPQNWPSLLKDLYDLCLMGPTQTELVLKTYLRLAEDVVVFQTIPAGRRRSVMQGLTANMGDLFQLFITLLQQHTVEMKEDTSEARLVSQWHCRVSQALLTTLAGYLDWINMDHIFSQNALLLQILCLLLSNSNLQLYAAECLLIIVSRKGKVEDRKPLLVLFSEDAMSIIWTTTLAAEQASHNEYYYLFLKRLCQVLTELGKQLCAMWGQLPKVEQPANFEKYLEALLVLTNYPSQMISCFTQSLWSSFLRHEIISADPILQSFIPRLFESSTKTLQKVGFPTQNNSPSCKYSRLDHDSDEEFTTFFSKYRAEIADTLKLAAVLQPKTAFTFAGLWLQGVLQKPIDTGEGSENGYCRLSSPSFIAWDAMTVCLESVMSRVLSAKPPPNQQEGICLLSSVLEFKTEDPLILSSLLSCISALFPFVNGAPDKLPMVLEKIFSAVTFNLPGQTKSTRSKAVKNVRQHACSILVKICKVYTDLLFPVFDKLYSHIQVISRDTEQLSQMEKCILIEALILISNKFHDFNKQSSFIEEVLKPVKDLWLSGEFKQAFWSAVKFMSYIGLDQAPVEPSSADTCGINRSHMVYCINTILAVLKRSRWPEDLQVASESGFVIGVMDDGTTALRNPATTHISVLLENLLALVKTMNSKWQPECLKLRHPAFDKSYDLSDTDRLAVLGIPPPCVDNSNNYICRQPLERMQLFLCTTHDTCCHILGNAGPCLGQEFYTIPNLTQSLLSTIFTNLDLLPDYRVKPMIRVFMKPFVQNCPRMCYETAVIPLLAFLCPYIYQRLSAKWAVINQRNSHQTEDGKTEAEDENPESQEVLDDQLTRQLSREYVDLLVTICRSRPSNLENTAEDQIMDEEVTPPDNPSNQQQPKETCLSELGLLCMKNEEVYPSIVMYVFNSLSWNDSTMVLRATTVCWLAIKQLLTDSKLVPEAVNVFFCAVLFGLQAHGQHEAAQNDLLLLGAQMYDLLRPHFPNLANILLQVPNCSVEAVKAFDEKILQSSPQKQIPDKKKKDLFKKLVADIIGKSVGQQFKREAQYKNLPPIYTIRSKQPSVDEVEPHTMGLCDLFKPINGNLTAS
ncbi:exportin-5-like [Mizuhopecten yessoensis]|uniref:exportin-5-like n=1 Tax=Mizuhopecten yessoensis TaxID=6573 RepID=UPI000B45B0F6|nr:exportin-5-like [Mizuhopecten yessoensis]